MTKRSSRLRGALVVLGLTGALVAAGVVAAPGLAQGPSAAQLAAQGWACFIPPTLVGIRCFDPGHGRPPVPPAEDGRPSYSALAWTLDGEFQGQVHLIRADLYHGQPCPQAGGLYVFVAPIGYFECNRF